MALCPYMSLGLTFLGLHKFASTLIPPSALEIPGEGNPKSQHPIPRALVCNRALLASKDSSPTSPLFSWSLSMSKQTGVHFPLQICHFPHANLHPPLPYKLKSSPVVVVRRNRHAWQRLLALEGPFLAPWVLSAGCHPCAVSSWSASY